VKKKCVRGDGPKKAGVSESTPLANRKAVCRPENIPQEPPRAADATASVTQCMRSGTRGAPDEYAWDEYKAEMTRLVDEHGPDFVCDHSCAQLRESGGVACRDGSCTQRHSYGGHTCRDACRSFIEFFLSHPLPVFCLAKCTARR
jgi:hypothetical protein